MFITQRKVEIAEAGAPVKDSDPTYSVIYREAINSLPNLVQYYICVQYCNTLRDRTEETVILSDQRHK